MADSMDRQQFGSNIRRSISIVSPSSSDSSLDGLMEEKAKLEKLSFMSMSSPTPTPHNRHQHKRTATTNNATTRLNKFVRRLHEMLSCEQGRGVVEWRRGVLVLHSINTIFAKEILPKYFGTRNFKTFRRQLNYYGFLHVRSFCASGSASTALWVNQELADGESDSISSVLTLKRVESNGNDSKSHEARREKKFEAASLLQVEKLVAGYNCDRKDQGVAVACDIPNIVHCQQQGLGKAHDALPVASCMPEDKYCPQHWNDPFIAAGLLLSLADAAA
ncbi:hypothetical protein ACHAWU_000463 [Discostella pseudostelligera]|uniref:HSF-type DNA-binding domain-containing protein n=1 Tax=Discostella pseudostelligera TaxID=259834 RepID=A0ABD3M263_9STRA